MEKPPPRHDAPPPAPSSPITRGPVSSPTTHIYPPRPPPASFPYSRRPNTRSPQARVLAADVPERHTHPRAKPISSESGSLLSSSSEDYTQVNSRAVANLQAYGLAGPLGVNEVVLAEGFSAAFREEGIGQGASSQWDTQWKRIRSLRESIRARKDRVALMREKVERKWRRMDEADNAHMKLVRRLHAELSGGATRIAVKAIASISRDMLVSFKLVQQRRNELSEARYMYNDEEAQLAKAEKELYSEETAFFRHVFPPAESTAQRTAPNPMAYLLSGISEDGPVFDEINTTHPLYLQFEDAVSDFHSLCERFGELYDLKEEHEYRVDRKRLLGRATSEDEDLLHEYSSDLERTGRELNEKFEKAMRLKGTCEAYRVMPRELPPNIDASFSAMLRRQGHNVEEVELSEQAPLSGTLAHHRLPLLVSQPDHLIHKDGPKLASDAWKAAEKLPDMNEQKRLARREISLATIFSNFKSGEKLDWVTRWLYLELKLSPLLALQLFLISDDVLTIQNRTRWQMDVLRLWWKDETSLSDDLDPSMTPGPYSAMVSDLHMASSGYA